MPLIDDVTSLLATSVPGTQKGSRNLHNERCTVAAARYRQEMGKFHHKTSVVGGTAKGKLDKLRIDRETRRRLESRLAHHGRVDDASFDATWDDNISSQVFGPLDSRILVSFDGANPHDLESRPAFARSLSSNDADINSDAFVPYIDYDEVARAAARSVQSAVRRFGAMRNMMATRIQAGVRGWWIRREMRALILRRRHAATVIARTWRRRRGAYLLAKKKRRAVMNAGIRIQRWVHRFLCRRRLRKLRALRIRMCV